MQLSFSQARRVGVVQSYEGILNTWIAIKLTNHSKNHSLRRSEFLPLKDQKLYQENIPTAVISSSSTVRGGSQLCTVRLRP
jgi:hypothetical protein